MMFEKRIKSNNIPSSPLRIRCYICTLCLRNELTFVLPFLILETQENQTERNKSMRDLKLP